MVWTMDNIHKNYWHLSPFISIIYLLRKLYIYIHHSASSPFPPGESSKICKMLVWDRCETVKGDFGTSLHSFALTISWLSHGDGSECSSSNWYVCLVFPFWGGVCTKTPSQFFISRKRFWILRRRIFISSAPDKWFEYDKPSSIFPWTSLSPWQCPWT